jgi:tRNA-splicing ligase RtcB
MSGYQLTRIDDYRWELPRSGAMRVPGRIFANEKLLADIENDDSIAQVANVACLPGVIGYSFAMPDMHLGYGFAIGGVAAMDLDKGVISPGGVGYDINCGVRLVRTGLKADEVRPKLEAMVRALFSHVPAGVGSSGAIKKVSPADEKKILQRGARWAVEAGLGTEEDLEFTEEHGELAGANPEALSERALERGRDQSGTLGSGNHFLEISSVADIFDEVAARAFGLWEGQMVLQVHSGSRGLGYQVCDDYIRVMLDAARRYGIDLPDRQLCCAPVKSKEGQRYYSAMAAAANYAWNNRQVIMRLAIDALERALSITPKALDAHLVWDVAHNIAKFEKHAVDGRETEVLVHRKGATRAFGPSREGLPERYRGVGQPVLIPGDMGRQSFVCVGTDAAEETFCSTCHGAGRVLSRHAAISRASGRNIIKELGAKGIIVMAGEKGTVAEEMPEAYKDVAEVVKVMDGAGISRKVARLVPMGVVKG